MKELVVVTIFSIIFYIISKILNIDRAYLSYIIDFTPTFIVLIALYKNNPKNYLKIMSLKNHDIIYNLNIKLNHCFISEKQFKEYINQQSENGYKINKLNIGEYVSLAEIKLNDGSLIDINYDNNLKELFISSKCAMRYKIFIKKVNKILSKVHDQFKNKGFSYDKLNISIKMEFIKDNKTYSNPFWSKVLIGFSNYRASCTYTTKNTSITISNESIEIVSTNNNIVSIQEDILKEFSVFNILKLIN